MLLDKGTSVDAQSGYFGNVLQAAVAAVHEGVYEDLARQNIVAHPFQPQLRFLCCLTWASVIVIVF
jgi:hypothetical protein